MAVNLLIQQDPPLVVMYDDRAMRALGPVVDGPDCVEILADFIQTLEDDPRTFTEWEMAFKWAGFVANRTGEGEPGSGASVTFEPAPEPAPMYSEPATVAPDAPARERENVIATNDIAANDASTLPGFGDAADPTVTLVPDAAPPARAQEPVTPADMPIGARVCWACNGHRSEPARPGEPCGICDGRGWLPG